MIELKISLTSKQRKRVLYKELEENVEQTNLQYSSSEEEDNLEQTPLSRSRVSKTTKRKLVDIFRKFDPKKSESDFETRRTTRKRLKRKSEREKKKLKQSLTEQSNLNGRVILKTKGHKTKYTLKERKYRKGASRLPRKKRGEIVEEFQARKADIVEKRKAFEYISSESVEENSIGEGIAIGDEFGIVGEKEYRERRVSENDGEDKEGRDNKENKNNESNGGDKNDGENENSGENIESRTKKQNTKSALKIRLRK
ncbi:hypothetical protein BPAE_0703g00010 [Botrytis paeoniae]|uniref:Uncharacterized protein n=1 Tax=Botrytis paeoniae TaxID=278948 RepID=A0A4Z1ETW5_9HELO|nr:hypothetical protein BPAE_0703g00010 [Botrytis paeoniae]